MFIIETVEQAEVIVALDLRSEARKALTEGSAPGYSRNQQQHADYSGPVEVLVVGTRGGVALNGCAQWGDVRANPETGTQEIVLDDTAEAWTLDGRRVASACADCGRKMESDETCGCGA